MQPYYEIHRDGFSISDDPARLDLDAVEAFLSRAYWAAGRPREATRRAFANSLPFGLYAGTRQIGMARVLSDRAVFAYLMDVFIHEAYRGLGLGKWLLESVMSHPELVNVRRWMLTTRDAHGLYAQYGFHVLDDPSAWMERLKPYPGE